MDMRREEQEGFKLMLNLLFLVIACGTLFVPINKAGSGLYERYNEGVWQLACSCLVICCSFRFGLL